MGAVHHDPEQPSFATNCEIIPSNGTSLNIIYSVVFALIMLFTASKPDSRVVGAVYLNLLSRKMILYVSIFLVNLAAGRANLSVSDLRCFIFTSYVNPTTYPVAKQWPEAEESCVGEFLKFSRSASL